MAAPTPEEERYLLSDDKIHTVGTALVAGDGTKTRFGLRFNIVPLPEWALTDLFRVLSERAQAWLADWDIVEGLPVEVLSKEPFSRVEFSDHEKFLLFTGLMEQMAHQVVHFTSEQIREMTVLSDKSRRAFGKGVDPDKSSEVLMKLARQLVE